MPQSEWEKAETWYDHGLKKSQSDTLTKSKVNVETHTNPAKLQAGHDEKQTGLKQQTKNFWNLLLYEIVKADRIRKFKKELDKLTNKRTINRD